MSEWLISRVTEMFLFHKNRLSPVPMFDSRSQTVICQTTHRSPSGGANAGELPSL